MYVVSVYRTEADGDPSRRHDDDPFDGHEIVGVFHMREEDVMNRQIDTMSRINPSWQFHIEQV